MWVEVALPLPIDHTFTYKVPEKLQDQIKTGQSVLVPFNRYSLKGMIVSSHQNLSDTMNHSLNGSAIKEIYSLLNSEFVFPEALLELSRWISEKYGCSWGESLELVSRPVKKGRGKLLEHLNEEQSVTESVRKTPFILTEDQKKVLDKVLQAVREEKQKTFLLFGVTASGKTEIYLNAIQEVLKRGKQAIFLVPEISLCPPFFEILRERFGERVGIWHSNISEKTKKSLFERIQKGALDIVVGARSALFVPFHKLGIIILDEEHDSSYKQDEKPRYHAKETAIKLAELHRGVVILGSATPSVESFYDAKTKRFELLELNQRIVSSSPAYRQNVGSFAPKTGDEIMTHAPEKIVLVDRRKTVNRFSPFSRELIDDISLILNRREQAILALNRRGFSTYLLCMICGHVLKCPDCQLTLVHHEKAGDQGKEFHQVMRCHYCFYEREIPSHCEKCNGQSFHFGGYGTQKVVQEIKKLFPFARVLRLDQDTARKKSAAHTAYKTFREESADILVGTQMVTQGFDFPRVTLVGIIDADTALFHPDFRAAERTFQWILQAAGRAGRSPLGGHAVVQSSLPDHYALQFGCAQDYRAFYNKEIEFRKTLFYPPFSKLVLLRVQSSDSQKRETVISESDRLADHLRKSCQNEFERQIQILGPGPSPREQLKKQFRWQILIKCLSDNDVEKVVKICRSFVPKSGIRCVIDVDPYDVL